MFIAMNKSESLEYLRDELNYEEYKIELSRLGNFVVTKDGDVVVTFGLTAESSKAKLDELIKEINKA